ncbi:MAG: phosphatidate cytidylyltransferase [Candidatus Pelagadaptatus aseana]|uniref:phosphatidate cytidylyltransferase n=1 Tax=Candidatus Pelagadaptatus aseana TaxID=3120508 RepID=UPI0039B2763C
MLKQRIITAVILAALFLGVIFLAPLQQYAQVISVVVAIAAWEWANMSGFKAQWQRVLYAIGILLLAMVAAGYNGYYETGVFSGEELLSVFGAAGIWWAVALLWVQSYPASAVLWGRRWTRAIMGVFVLVPTWLAFIFLRTQPNGEWLIILLVVIVAAADVGAYFVGKNFGKRKLAVHVSPKKSWEGFWGGFALCLLLATGFCYWAGEGYQLVAIVAPVALVSVLGDLMASMVKRERGIKDSSNLLPGHGGFMDRVDSLTAAAPIFSLAILLTGWEMPAF